MRKTFAIVMLCLVMFHGEAYAAERKCDVTPIYQKVTVDEKAAVFTAYNINGSNYFNLSELAAVFENTAKGFTITDNDALNEFDNVKLSTTDSAESDDACNAQTYMKNITYMDKSFDVPTYKLNGEHYCKLRTVANTLDFAVDWNPNNNAINIDTNRPVNASVTVEKIVPTNTKIYNEMKLRDGMLGRWQIPSANIDVAIFNSGSQETVDRTDSAGYFRFGTMYVIGDHSNQDFRTLQNCNVGDFAYIDNGIEKTEYVCTAKFKGHNTSKDLTDENYNTIKYSNEAGITCYTCNGSWKNIWILFFQPTY